MFVETFLVCLVNVCISIVLTALWFQHSQIKPRCSSPVTHKMWLRNSTPSLWYHSKNSMRKPFYAFCACLWVFLEPILWKTCDNLACGNIIQNTAWNLWKFTWKFRNCDVLSYTNFLVHILNKNISHYKWPTISLFIVNICSPIFVHSTLLSYNSFTHYILAVNCRA
jgi:hypothetical protein